MVDKANIREWKDADESKIRVVRWPNSGRAIFDTAPGQDGIDHVVELERDQIKELIQFLRAL